MLNMVIRKLAFSNLLVHRTRTILTAAAIALSVSLVVAVTSGYASLEAMAGKFAGRYMGSADAVITRRSITANNFPESIVDDLRKDPRVKRVTGRMEMKNYFTDSKNESHEQNLVGIRRPIDDRIENLEPTIGKWFDTPDGKFAVIDQVSAELQHVGIGGLYHLASPTKSIDLVVTGIVQKPAVLAQHIQTIYLPLMTLQSFADADHPPMVNRALVDLNRNVSQQAFAKEWGEKLKVIDPLLTLHLGRDVNKIVDTNLQGVHLMSYLGGSVSMLAATFIIFSALSMGVTERSRTLAMMRAIGAVRGQVAQLVVVEGLLLATAAVLIGVPLGWFWLFLLKLRYHAFLPHGFATSWEGITFAAVGSLVDALLASLLPAWWATRVRPLEAMAPMANPSSKSVPWLAAIPGLLLIAVDPAILFTHWSVMLADKVDNPIAVQRQITVIGHFILGLPTMMLGFFLIAPLFVVLLEKVAAPSLAKVMQLKGALLRQQLSGGVWRVAGTCAALMVGLSILIAMETQGNSILSAWQLPDKFPDIFIVSWGIGLKGPEIEQLAHTKGIVAADLLPIAVANPQLPSIAGSKSSLAALTLAAITPDATMFIGVNPEVGMRIMELKFVQGNRPDAIRLLDEGDHVIVTDEFYQLRHLGMGDTLPLATNLGTVNFKIAGVVSSPGMDLVNARFDMGQQFDQRTQGSIFGSFKDAQKYFGANEIHLFAANLQPGEDKDKLLKEVSAELGNRDMQAGDVRQIKEQMQSTFHQLLAIVSVVPFAAMFVASLGVTNTIMASIRTRRWQLGVLRSIGLTRSQLLRLVLSESFLVGVVASALGLFAGAVMTVDGHRLSWIVTGLHPAIVVPWIYVIVGVSAVMIVSLLAGAWPAVNVSRAEPLSLLQGGRSTS
jgi:putative ABC transport system permease protein